MGIARWRIGAIAVIGCLLACLSGWAARPTVAEPQATSAGLQVWPADITVRQGEVFELEFRVSDIQELYALDVRLAYDPHILQVEAVCPGEAPQPDFVVRKTADEAIGSIWYAVTQLNPRSPFAGEGVVCRIVWRAKAMGNSSIMWTNHQLVTRYGEEIPHTVVDGLVQVRAEQATPTVTPMLNRTRRPTRTPWPTCTPRPSKTPGDPSRTPRASHTPPFGPPATPTATVTPMRIGWLWRYRHILTPVAWPTRRPF